MFELEDYSSSIHEGFFSKYADAAGPSLDFYVSDSMQDMLDVDIRAEIANVVGSSSDMSSLDHALEAISAINNSNNNNNSNTNSLLSSTHNANANLLATSALHASPTAKWMGSCANFWSTADYYADVGACVNPISVMPLINSNSGCTSLLGSGSPQKTRGGGGATAAQGRAGSAAGQSLVVPPASPCDQHKSHLTFSPAQMKVSAGSMRREQVMAHIPKQISALPISSSAVTGGGATGVGGGGGGATAPGTMATNSALQMQRRNSPALDAVRKDLGTELRKVQSNMDQETKNTAKNNNSLLTTNGATSTIKLGPGIGGLTFANSATYNKLKQQTSVKSPNGAPLTSNGNILLKRDREASPLHNMATLHATKRGSAPKSIASAAHSPHHQMQMQSSLGSPSSTSSSTSGRLTSTASSSPLSNNNNNSNSNNNSNHSNVKTLQQKMKVPAAAMSSMFPKPAYSYSCLIALALKNSRAGSLPVSEIYSFLCQHFPYFENAPSGWKNSVRHNLSLNKCFEKIERPATNSNQRKGCRWAMNPERICKMDEEVQKWSRKDPAAIRNAMVYPEHLESLERGEMKHGSADSDVELDSQSEIEESSDLEEHDFDDTLIDAMLVEEEENDDVDWANSEDEDQEEFVSCKQSSNHLPTNHQMLLAQKNADFDIEVDELYDAIEIEDDKEAVRNAIASGRTHNSIIELNPADLNVNDGYQSPKRARLDINYAIGPAGELEQQYGQKVKVQQVQQITQQQQPPTYNRRKMPLVNRII
ncbi:homeobox protein 12 [Drosophila innubila]|uniref:homeobox protein 12 n=1 Tax=Drosophila innubila TaxID=198719 RepID=UPI00148D6681|nr:homeobox protein 12 [Drosophila innubila]